MTEPQPQGTVMLDLMGKIAIYQVDEAGSVAESKSIFGSNEFYNPALAVAFLRDVADHIERTTA